MYEGWDRTLRASMRLLVAMEGTPSEETLAAMSAAMAETPSASADENLATSSATDIVMDDLQQCTSQVRASSTKGRRGAHLVFYRIIRRANAPNT